LKQFRLETFRRKKVRIPLPNTWFGEKFPSLANGTPIEFAIEQLKAKGFMTDVLKDNGVESIAWVPWSRLL
jgi:hypothetical protein